MPKKIIAFGASNSKNSINKKLAVFTASKLSSVEVETLDLNDYKLPVYSIDDEKESGFPDAAISFLDKVKSSDGIVVSVAEHNGLHTAVFKNLWDWMSRIEGQTIWNDKPMFLLSASPSRREENNVMKVSKQLFPFFGADIIATFYLPSFNHFFKDNQIIEMEYKKKFETELAKYQSHLDLN